MDVPEQARMNLLLELARLRINGHDDITQRAGLIRNHITATDDDQSRTWDGRVLNTKEAVLAFLAEIEEARNDGRSLDPHDKQP